MFDRRVQHRCGAFFLVTCLALSAIVAGCTSSAPATQAPSAPAAAAAAKPAGTAPSAATQSKSTAPAATPAAAAAAKPAASAAKTIKIGAIAPLTGPTAASGASAKRGLELAVEYVNNSGGIKSMGGAKLELILEDHQGKADVAIGLAERMIQNDKVAILLGSMDSASTMATTQVAERLGVPHVVPMDTNDEITERGFKYTFRLSPTSTMSAQNKGAFFRWLEAKTGKKFRKIALLYEDSGFGQSQAKSQKNLFSKEQGFDIVADVSYAPGGRDYTAVVSKLKAANPDVIMQSSLVNDAILLRKTMDQLGVKALIVGQEGGNGHPDYIKNVGPLAEGEIFGSFSCTDLPGDAVKAYANAYRAKYNINAENIATFHYEAVLVAKDALERASTDDHAAVQKALTETALPAGPWMVLPTDVLRFDAKGQSILSTVMLQIQNGVPRTIYPDSVKQVDLLLPQ